MTRRLALLAVPVLLAAVVVAVTAPIDAAAQQDGDIAPVDVVVELRVWQDVNDGENIQVSARPLGGDWGTVGTIPFPLDNVYEARGSHFISYYHYGDLEVAGATLRIWQESDDPEHIAVCAHRCADPRTRSVSSPLGAIVLPLDDGHTRRAVPLRRPHRGDHPRQPRPAGRPRATPQAQGHAGRNGNARLGPRHPNDDVDRRHRRRDAPARDEDQPGQ